MAENDNERDPVPARPKKKKQLRKYYEQNKDAIVADYNLMKLLLFFKKWGIGSTAWTKLKAEWGVPGKNKSPRAVPAAAKPEAVPEELLVDVSLSEHERYLILLGWQQAAREFLKAGYARHSL